MRITLPKLNNKSLNIFVDIDTEDAINSAIVQIPSLIPRFLTYLMKVLNNML